MKHTPGPWEAEQRTSSIKIIANGEIVASIYKEGNAEANAKLIAAAPELLEEAVEALKELRSCYKLLGIDDVEEQKLNGLKAAIKKATGE